MIANPFGWRNEIYVIANKITDRHIENQINILFLNHDKERNQCTNIGKANNQKFVSIPWTKKELYKTLSEASPKK